MQIQKPEDILADYKARLQDLADLPDVLMHLLAEEPERVAKRASLQKAMEALKAAAQKISQQKVDMMQPPPFVPPVTKPTAPSQLDPSLLNPCHLNN